MTIQADGPCGLCVPHVKGFDSSANLTPGSYLDGFGRSGSISAESQSQSFKVTFHVAGSGPGARAAVYTVNNIIHPYGDFTGGVEVAMTKIKEDGIGFGVVTGTGAGGGPHVKVFEQDPNTVYQETGGFFAYAPTFGGGVRVAVGDVYGGDAPEIVTAAGPGGGPHVRVFTMAGQLISEFYAYAPNVVGGLSVAVGDVVSGGKQEIVTGAGPGGAAHVKTFDYLGRQAGPGFYAYDPAFTGGVWVAVGNVDEQGVGEIVTGAGVGGMPHVRWFTSPDGAFTNPGFFAYEDLPTGVRVAAPRD